MNAIVVGAGSFGSWSALKLLNSGHDVTLVDAWGPGKSRASSGGETRVIRTVYGQDEIYVEMAKHSMDQWDWFQKKVDKRLMELVGSIWLCGVDDSYVQSAATKIRSLGLRLDELDIDQATERWPQINFEGLEKVIYEPSSGYLRARQACQAVVQEFVAQGGTYITDAVKLPENLHAEAKNPIHDIPLASGQVLSADNIIFACGPWLGKIFPEWLGPHIQVSRQEVYFFGPATGDDRFNCPQLPIWLELREPIYYGIPSVDRRGFKVARDERGEDFDPTSGDRTLTRHLVEKTKDYVAKRFPGLAGAPLVESRVCQYSNTPDGHFILDRHDPSGFILVGGGSGGKGCRLARVPSQLIWPPHPAMRVWF